MGEESARESAPTRLREERLKLRAGRKKKSRRSRAAVNPSMEPYW